MVVSERNTPYHAVFKEYHVIRQIRRRGREGHR